MNTFILVGFDLVVSALLILLGMFVVWSRFRTQLEVDGNREIAPTVKTRYPRNPRRSFLSRSLTMNGRSGT